MKIILSSNPYRDRGLRAAMEAQRVLERSGAQTVLCLPFRPKRGDRLEIPRQAVLGELEKELPQADLLVSSTPPGTRPFTMCPFWGSTWEVSALWRSWSAASCPAWPVWPITALPQRSA